jgi:hypothetical protein
MPDICNEGQEFGYGIQLPRSRAMLARVPSTGEFFSAGQRSFETYTTHRMFDSSAKGARRVLLLCGLLTLVLIPDLIHRVCA